MISREPKPLETCGARSFQRGKAFRLLQCSVSTKSFWPAAQSGFYINIVREAGSGNGTYKTLCNGSLGDTKSGCQCRKLHSACILQSFFRAKLLFNPYIRSGLEFCAIFFVSADGTLASLCLSQRPHARCRKGASLLTNNVLVRPSKTVLSRVLPLPSCLAHPPYTSEFRLRPRKMLQTQEQPRSFFLRLDKRLFFLLLTYFSSRFLYLLFASKLSPLV